MINTVSALKSLGWRIVATVTTVTILFLVTHQLKYALSIGSIEMAVKLFIYYGHARIWATALSRSLSAKEG